MGNQGLFSLKLSGKGFAVLESPVPREELIEIDDVGPVVAHSIAEWFRDEINLEKLFIKLGYSLEDYKLIRNKIELSDIVLYDYVNNNYKWLLGLYSKKDIIRMTKICPFLYSLNFLFFVNFL